MDTTSRNPRKGCHDIWNAFMLEGARYSSNDIPHCPTTAITLPLSIITWTEAKRLYKSFLARKQPDFYVDAFVCFYEDDYKFDGTRGIWHDYNHALKVLRHFAGVITPDFSTYQDFPEPIKLYATFRMRAYGYWLGQQGLSIINNVRWGTPETYRYCFDGIDKDSIVAIGTVGGNPWKLRDRDRFDSGLMVMVERLCPRTIIVYGSANYPCFNLLSEHGIQILSFPGKTDSFFKRRNPV